MAWWNSTSQKCCTLDDRKAGEPVSREDTRSSRDESTTKSHPNLESAVGQGKWALCAQDCKKAIFLDPYLYSEHCDLTNLCRKFPTPLANEEDYKRELAAYVVLSRSSAPSDAQAACDALTAPSEAFRASRWPRCFGTLRTRKDPTSGEWTHSDAGVDRNPALLFEYVPDLERLTRNEVTEDLSREYKQVLADLHALKILHHDQILHAAWPEIAFNNVFLRKNKTTGTKGG